VGSAISRRVYRQIGDAADPFNEMFTVETASLLPSSARPFFQEFANLLCETVELDSPAEIIDLVLKETYDDYLVSHYDGAAMRREDIRALANFAGQYRNVEAFLADVALAGEFSGETCVEGPIEQEFVILSTIHQAKGLEWPIVFVPWLADGRFPTDMAMNTDDDLQEERRVFHVAVTRARDELYLVVPQVYRNRSQKLIMMKPSRFLTELAHELTEQMELEEGLPHLIGGAEEDHLLPPVSESESPPGK
jgi:DNA helicase-2/ATP-dependent DNA helicase PcrA